MFQNIYYDRNKDTIHLWDDTQGYLKFDYKPYAYRLDSNGQYITLDKKLAKKVYTWTKADEKAGLIYESDVPTEMRVLVDLYHDSDTLSTGHNICIIDIEVSTDGGVSPVADASNPITAISIYDKSTDWFYAFILDENSKIQDSVNDNVTIRSFKHEDDLLYEFLKVWKKLAPTIISGWNISAFDIPYLYNRLIKVLGKYRADTLSPIEIVKYSDRDREYTIAGISVLDAMTMYKKYTYGVRASYALDAIAMDELGRGKIKYNGTLKDLYEQDINKYIEYNIEDVRLVRDIDLKRDLIYLTMNICHKGHIPYEDYIMTSRYLEGASLVYLKKKNIVAPNKQKVIKLQLLDSIDEDDTRVYMTETIPESIPRVGSLKLHKTKSSVTSISYSGYSDNYFILEEPADEYISKTAEVDIELIGAYVKKPTPGRYEWVYDLDIESMYPSTIRTLNISPETKIGRIIDYNVDDFATDVEREYILIDIESKQHTIIDLRQYLTRNNYAIASNGVIYDQSERGLIPSILDIWFFERKKYVNLAEEYGNAGDKDLYRYYDSLQLVIKVLLNSFYGALGLASFRFHDIDNAEAITDGGQTLIKFTEKMANYKYNTELNTDEDYTIYIDTDSIFMSVVPLIKYRFPDVNTSDKDLMVTYISKIATEVQDYLNESYNLFADRIYCLDKHFLKIKQEVISDAAFWVSKKRYAQHMIYKKGVKVDSIDVKGLDTTRSDFPSKFRVFMKNILRLILDGKTAEDVRAEVFDFKSKLSSFNVYEIIAPRGIKDISKHDVDRHPFTMKKGTPVHVKSALYYNDLLDYYNINTVEKIVNGDKIKWGYLRKNPYKMTSLAIKGYNDPKEIVDLLTTYLDYDMTFEKGIDKKVQSYFNAMNWGLWNINQNAGEFFTF